MALLVVLYFFCIRSRIDLGDCTMRREIELSVLIETCTMRREIELSVVQRLV